MQSRQEKRKIKPVLGKKKSKILKNVPQSHQNQMPYEGDEHFLQDDSGLDPLKNLVGVSEDQKGDKIDQSNEDRQQNSK